MNTPKEYTLPVAAEYSGTDIYLSIVSGILTAFITRIILMISVASFGYTASPNLLNICMSVTSLLAVYRYLSQPFSDGVYRERVTNSIGYAFKMVTIVPFTAFAHIARSTTNGFTFTRNLTD